MTSPVNNEEAIINLVKAKPFLWNIKDPEYKNISLKTEEFENIGRNFNLTGDEIRRKWRSLRSGFRRELLARSNKKPKPKQKQWKHFNKLLFLRESENIRDTLLSDNEFEDNQQHQQQQQQQNNTICVNQADVSAETDFSDLMQINSPISNLVESATACENGDIRLNIITNTTTNDNKDKTLQEVNENTQFKIIPSNINTTLQPSQIYFVKTANGVSDMSPLLFIKKSDQTTTHTTTTQQLNEEHYHHQPDHHQQHQQNLKTTTTITTTPATNLNNRSNDLILNSFKNNVQVKNKKRMKDDSDDELDADDYFGRMVAQLIKEFDEEQRKSCRLAVLQLITEWTGKKNHQENSK